MPIDCNDPDLAKNWAMSIGIPSRCGYCICAFHNYGRPGEYSFQVAGLSVECVPGCDSKHWIATLYRHSKREFEPVHVHRDTLRRLFNRLYEAEAQGKGFGSEKAGHAFLLTNAVDTAILAG